MSKKYGYSKDETGNICYTYPYFPIGYIYISAVEIDLNSIFGGTWEQIQGRFLLGCSSDYSAGSTGGEATHTLTTSEMPSHNHNAYFYGYSGWPTITVPSKYVLDWTLAKNQSGGNVELETTKTSNQLVTDTGGGEAHNNMPPYLSVYMYQKTAD